MTGPCLLWCDLLLPLHSKLLIRPDAACELIAISRSDEFCAALMQSTAILHGKYHGFWDLEHLPGHKVHVIMSESALDFGFVTVELVELVEFHAKLSWYS